MKRIVCIVLSALLCCVGTVEAEKQQLHNDKGVVSAKTDAQTERMNIFTLRLRPRQTM